MFLCESGLASVVSPLVRTRNWEDLKGPRIVPHHNLARCPTLTSRSVRG